jgi:hypothetical protein
MGLIYLACPYSHNNEHVRQRRVEASEEKFGHG